MKTLFLIISFSLFSNIIYAQVGINTENPQVTLDVVADPNNSSLVDGFLAPRLTGDELKAKDDLYGLAQTGTIIYVTSKVTTPSIKTAKILSSGYYYFDGSNWVNFGTDSNNTEKDWFYAPSIILPTSSIGISNDSSDDINYNSSNETYTIKLFSIYKKQFEFTGDIDGLNRSAIKSNPNSSLDVIGSDELDYFVLYFDNTVFDPNTISISPSGELTYKILPTAVITDKTFMNIVFKRK